MSIAFDQERLRKLIDEERLDSLFPPLKKNQLQTLQDLLTSNNAQEVAAVAPAIQNRRVRELLRPILLSGSVEHKQKASSWIVKNWGGIKRHNKERFDALVKSFNDFSVPTIEICIGALGFDRVSSWSKLISFAHPDEYPVYDAKAVSKLNSLLIGPNTTRFYVPPT